MHLLAKRVVVPGYLVNMLLRDAMGIFWASLSSDEAGLKECLFSTWEATDAEWLVWPSTRKGISALRSTLAASRHPHISSSTWQHSRFHMLSHFQSFSHICRCKSAPTQGIFKKISFHCTFCWMKTHSLAWALEIVIRQGFLASKVSPIC